MKRLIALILAGVISSGALISCNPGSGTDTTTTTPDNEEITTVPEPEQKTLVIAKDGQTVYRVVSQDECSDSLKAAASALYVKIKETYGISDMTITTDFEKRGTNPEDRYKYEILIGATNRDETADAMTLIGYNDFIITVGNEKVVILGGCEDATKKALNFFAEHYLSEGELVIDGSTADIVRGENDKENIVIDGTPLKDYTIVYSPRYRTATTQLAARLGSHFGAIMKSSVETAEQTDGRKIIIGSTKFGSDEFAAFSGSDEFSIKMKNGNIIISGGSDTAVKVGCAELSDIIARKDGSVLGAADVTFDYKLPDRQVYINDISQFRPKWAIDFDVPTWMLDYDEKYAAMNTPNGRLMSNAHRGDSVYYPENSIEAIISAIRMGIDMIETDPVPTKDGVFVIMHDSTLTRTTDWSDKKGKNGLPTSSKITDWTYEQLMQLNLKDKNGGESAAVTPYKIPTLDEVVKVCAGRTMIRLDVKGPDGSSSPYWNYSKDIWPLEQKYNSYDNIIFTWHGFNTSSGYSQVKTYKQKQTAACGRSAVFFIGCNASATPSSIMNLIRGNNLDYCVRLTDFSVATDGYETYLSKNEAKLAAFKGNVRIYVDAHNGKGTSAEGDEYFAALYDAGINFLLVNQPLVLCKYIAGNFNATDHK